MEIHRKQFGKIIIRGVSTAAAAERQVDDHLAALGEGIGAPLFAAPPGGVSVKVKDALLRHALSIRVE